MYHIYQPFGHRKDSKWFLNVQFKHLAICYFQGHLKITLKEKSLQDGGNA